MMRAIKAIIPCVAIVWLTSVPVHAGILVEQRFGTSDIIVPVFDANLGTLQSVQLQVQLHGGVTSFDGAHSHAPYTVFSNNTRSNTQVNGFSGVPVPVSSTGPHSHSAITPFYSGGGLSIGNFSLFMNPDGSHSHSATASYNGLQFTGSGWRAAAVIQVNPTGPHNHLYSEVSQSQAYSGSGLTPFLEASDIVIAGGPFTTSLIGHGHSVSGFNVTVGSSSGPWTWFFPGSSVSGGEHNHTITPNFSTTTTFFYEPHQDDPTPVVPEPSSLALLAIGMLTVGVARIRRRRQAREAA